MPTHSDTTRAARVAALMAQDQPTLDVFRDHGDAGHQARDLIVYFIGSESAIDQLVATMTNRGWKFNSKSNPEGGEVYASLSRQQTLTPEAMRAMNEDLVNWEDQFSVEYDGWEAELVED